MRLGLVFAVVLVVAAHLQASDQQARDELIALLLGTDRAERDRLQRLESTGLLTLDPVVVPHGADLFGSNWALRHPVAAGHGQEMMVVFVRSPYHDAGAPTDRRPDHHTSNHVMVRSSDGGKTWSSQADLRTFFDAPNPTRIAGMHALHRFDDGRYLYISGAGAMTSDDFGQTWYHQPGAFGTALPAGVGGANFGPTIVEHPDLGLVAISHAWGINGQILDELWLWTSRDGGRTWQRHQRAVATPAKKNVEPALVRIGDELAFVARSHDTASYEPVTDTFRYSQGVIDPDSLEITTTFTNIRTSNASQELAQPLAGQGYAASKAAAFGYWSQDTAEVIFNPITGRVEAVVVNRTGRANEHTDDLTRQSLSLWSIAPDDLLAGDGDWRYEGTLLERHMIDAPQFVDGMHPAGSIVDVENGVQHLFIYAGYYTGPAGIFKVTRSLRTGELAAALVPEPATAVLFAPAALLIPRRGQGQTP